MHRRRPLHLLLAAAILTAGTLLPGAPGARAQVREPGDPPPANAAAEATQVPDAPPDTAGGMAPIPNPEEGPSWATEEETSESGAARPANEAPQPKGTPLPPKRGAESAPAPAAATPAAATPAAPAPAPGPGKAEAGAEDPGDFLCARAPAGTTAPVPPPFDRWLVRVCSERGQALVPVLGEAWVAHNSADPVSILAMPPGAVPPPSVGAFDARYDIRFETFEGGKAEGDRHERAAGLIETASGPEKTPSYDEIWQLDAVSNVAGARYNLFFYVAGERPGKIIACLDQCRQALYLDVLTGPEAREVLGR